MWRSKAAVGSSTTSAAEPTSTIALDGLLFTRLAGGRTAVPTTDAIAYGGDEAVGQRIVEHLNYVI